MSIYFKVVRGLGVKKKILTSAWYIIEALAIHFMGHLIDHWFVTIYQNVKNINDTEEKVKWPNNIMWFNNFVRGVSTHNHWPLYHRCIHVAVWSTRTDTKQSHLAIVIM